MATSCRAAAMTETPGPRLLHYTCGRCRLLYVESWINPAPNPHLGICPRCGDFNAPDEAGGTG